jgi:hypothetical protein
MWLHRYFLDEDSSVVETVSYLDTEDDVFHVMSIFFQQTFEGKLYNGFGKNIDGSKYKEFLMGEYFDKDMVNIDYNSVSTNITEMFLWYSVELVNGTVFNGTSMRHSYWKTPYISYTWKSWKEIVKCFGLEITDKNVFGMEIGLKRDIFPNRIRPQIGGFVVLFHYPNQILNSIGTVTREWKKKNKKDNYWMSFYVTAMNAIQYRFKSRNNNCFQNWKEYDISILEKHIKSVGCRTPDTNTKHDWPICESKEKMKKARYHLRTGDIQPCREIESINYQKGDSDGPFIYRGVKNWVSIIVENLNPKFKLTIQKKEVDFQTLVGNIGGYIGIFLGFAIPQIPDTILETLKLGKSLYALICKIKSRQTSQIQQT